MTAEEIASRTAVLITPTKLEYDIPRSFLYPRKCSDSEPKNRYSHGAFAEKPKFGSFGIE